MTYNRLYNDAKGLKNSICFFVTLLFLGTTSAVAQTGPIKLYRSLDDFSYLLTEDSVEKRLHEYLKYIPLSNNAKVNISFGGEIREQYQYFFNANFGDFPPGVKADRNGHIWHRIMLHSDLRLGDDWRIFTQFNSTFTVSKSNITPQIDKDPFALHQAFIRWSPKRGNGFFMQLGRQELNYGSPYIIAVREMPNNRLAFDAAVFGLEMKKYKLYTFVATPIISQQGTFDNTRISEYIWCFYSVLSLNKKWLDIYYLGMYSENNSYNFQSGIERRHTLGLRIYNKATEGFRYEALNMYQFGIFKDVPIFAYYLTGDFAYKIPYKGHLLTPGFSINYISGDRSPSDNVLNTYNMLFSRPSFGLSLPIGATNLISLGPYFAYKPSSKVRITLSNYFIWRQSENDGIYSPGRVQIRPNSSQLTQAEGRGIGSKLSLEMGYLMSNNWNFFLEFSRVYPGEYIINTGEGNPITYLSGKFSYKF